ncbi:MAG: oxygenase MpaB family protein [Gordonia sp. (in: high G+C Gram-positive bacteria)]|uniref:oxygenase MpaB family protein n=1 Tax=Gordonia sp. (in: high G+C Gram-positive bacteria) TaxID=84139 RepID=UPI003C77F724
MSIDQQTQPGSIEAEATPVRRPAPTAFPYREAMSRPMIRRARKLAKRLTGKDLFPTAEQIEAFHGDMYHADPVAERFVDEVFYGEIGQERGREILKQALAHGIESIEDPPESMVALFREFEEVPEWVDPALVEAGAQIWRRWGTFLFSVAGGETLEMYTEAAVATPLSLAGGYAGDNALRRFLETSRFWIDVSEPGALLTPGSKGRATAMLVRVMHVSVRRRVADHPEWHIDRWGIPISQAYMLLTLSGGSVVPALALWLVGVQTTRREIYALIHFQRYMGHIVGVRNTWYPETIADTLRLLALVSTARSHDSGEHGAELIESFPKAFAPRGGHTGLQRLREEYNGRIYAAYSRLFMMPWTYAKYRMPNAWPGLGWIALRFPLLAAVETARRIPPIGRLHETVMVAHRESWYRAQMSGREAEFDASGALRR